MLYILCTLFFGLLAGLVAKAIVGMFFPEHDVVGVIPTTIVGIAGSYVGGFADYLLTGMMHFHPSGFLFSVGGAIVALVVLHYLKHQDGQGTKK